MKSALQYYTRLPFGAIHEPRSL